MKRQIGTYRILREIARGGMGVVYLAEHAADGRRVALKVLPFSAAQSQTQVHRFRREAEAAGKLDHPNIVRIHETGEEDGTHYFSMEYIEGRTLDAVIEELRFANRPSVSHRDLATAVTSLGGGRGHSEDITRTPPVPDRDFMLEAVKLVVQLAKAAQYAHDHGVIHRDIKPSNIILDGEGKPMLMDFGLARDVEDTAITRTGESFGTPSYMSPEQVLGQRAIVDGRTDVYSLGVTLYELTTLRLPFRGASSQEVLRKILTLEPERPSRANPALPRDLETIILTALEKDPAHRYPRAGDLADDLERFLDHEAIVARPPAPLVRAARALKRHRARGALVALALLVVGLVSLWWTFGRRTTLMVETSPPGARVFIDGIHKGETGKLDPIPLEPGPCRLKLELEGYLDRDEEIVLVRGRNHIAPDLKRRRVLLDVPEGVASITLTNEHGTHFRGSSGGRGIDIPSAGRYRVEVRMEDHSPAIGFVEIQPDGEWASWEPVEGNRPRRSPSGEAYVVELARNLGRLRIAVHPEAAVRLIPPDGVEQEIRQRFWESDVAPGSYRIEVADLLHVREERTVEVTRERTRDVTLLLEDVLRTNIYPTSRNSLPPHLADLDGDGRLEILVLSEEGASLDPTGHCRIVRESGGRLLSERSFPATVGYFRCPPACADLDGDGFRDIITVCGDELQLWLSVHSGKDLSLRDQFPLDAGPVSDLVVADLDLNGLADVALGIEGRGILVLWSGVEPKFLEVPGLRSFGRECVDLNGDGIPDLVSSEVQGGRHFIVVRSAQDGSVVWQTELPEAPDPRWSRAASSRGERTRTRTLPFFSAVDLDPRTGREGEGEYNLLVRLTGRVQMLQGLDGRPVRTFELEGEKGSSSDPELRTPFAVGNILRRSPGSEILVPTALGIDVFSPTSEARVLRLDYPDLSPLGGLPGQVRRSVALALAPFTGELLDLVLVLDGAVHALEPKVSGELDVHYRYLPDTGEMLLPAVGDIDGDGAVELVATGTDGGVYCLAGAQTSVLWRWESPHRMAGSFVRGQLDGDGLDDVAFVEARAEGLSRSMSWDHRLVALSGRGGGVIREWGFNGRFEGPPALLDVDGDGRQEILLTLLAAAGTRDFPILAVIPPDVEKPPAFIDLARLSVGSGDLRATRVGLFGEPAGLGAVSWRRGIVTASRLGLGSPSLESVLPHHGQRGTVPQVLFSIPVEAIADEASVLRVPSLGSTGIAGIPAGVDLDGDGATDLVVAAATERRDGDGEQILLALSGRDGSVLWKGPAAPRGCRFDVRAEDLDTDGRADLLVRIVVDELVAGREASGELPHMVEVQGLQGSTGVQLFAVDTRELLGKEPVVDAVVVAPRRAFLPSLGDVLFLGARGSVARLTIEEGRILWKIDLSEERGGLTHLVTSPGERELALVHGPAGVGLVNLSGRDEEWHYRPHSGSRVLGAAFLHGAESRRTVNPKRRRDVLVQAETGGRQPFSVLSAFRTSASPRFLWNPGCPSEGWAFVRGARVAIRRRLLRGEPTAIQIESLLRRLDVGDVLRVELQLLEGLSLEGE